MRAVRGLPGPRMCRCPTTSSTDRGRIRVARGTVDTGKTLASGGIPERVEADRPVPLRREPALTQVGALPAASEYPVKGRYSTAGAGLPDTGCWFCEPTNRGDPP